jgi:hypothetical protein
MLEVRDLDEWTEAEEVVEVMMSASGVDRDFLRVISLRKKYGGMQSALILASAVLCQNIVAHGRIRVGMVNCRIRLDEQKIRCYRCLSFGHMSSQC